MAILSLFSPAVLRFYPKQPGLRRQLEWDDATDTPAHAPDGQPQQCLVLQPRSLLLFAGDAFETHCHEVAACPSGREVAGGAESGEFLRQSRDMADVWAAAGAQTRFEALPGLDHFTVLDPLFEGNSPLVERLVELAGR